MYYYVIKKKDPVSYWQAVPDNRNNGFTYFASDARQFSTFKEAEQEMAEQKLKDCVIVIHFISEE